MTSPTITKPTFEHHHSGIGIGKAKPRISWRFQSSKETAPGWLQTGYEIELTLAGSEPEVFKVDTDQSLFVPWPARGLKSRERASVRVRVFGKSESYNGESPWSESAIVEAALLDQDEFSASFITVTDLIGPAGPLQPLRFRRQFELGEDIPSAARLYITALGVFHAYINGKRVSDEEMAPGWTSYKSRLNYRIWEVTSLKPGINEIVIEAAEGWWAGRLGFKGGKRFHYGDQIAIAAQLEVGGTTVLTDESWNCSAFELQSSEIYDGELLDMTKKDNVEFPTKVIPKPAARLCAADAPPVRVTESIAPREIFKSKSGKVIIDFGQNLVGKLQVKNLEVARQVQFKHAEVMENGELGTRPLRLAANTDTIIGEGTLPEWTPQFTFHGFRYVQVDGWEPVREDISALVMHTDMRRRGFFECSNGTVNQLHSNVVWSMRGNFLSIPTDCPQRDERLGWTGDIQVFTPTASFLYDPIGMLSEWMEDVASEQKGGIPPLVVPDVIPPNWPWAPQAVWDDVVILTPNALYSYSSDKEILERQFESMRSWLEEGVDREGGDGLWNPDRWQLADWLDPAAPPEDPGAALTDNVLVADAYLVHITKVFSEICKFLGKGDLEEKYKSDADDLRSKFQHRYITPGGNLMSNTQTGLALSVQFGLYPSEHLEMAKRRLTKLVKAAKFHIATGFAGTPIITHALTKVGLSQLAYRMLLEKTCPSWMYPVLSGATTIWERWDSMLPDGRINPGQMTSFNHYALGSVADWLHTTVGGIAALEPGCRKIKIHPVPGGNLRWAKVSFDGPYGNIACSWNLDEGKLHVEVPPNCSALVVLPDGEQEVQSGVHEFEFNPDLGEWPPQPIVAINQQLPEPQIAE